MKFLSFAFFLCLSTTHFFNPLIKDDANKMNDAAIKDSLKCQQMLVVIADGWDTLKGTLYAYNKVKDKWVLQFSNPIVLGEKGLGLGTSLINIPIENVPHKKEGDMKSPAGIFSIGTAFGYAPKKEATWINNAYVPCTDTLICVDDLHSVNYNKIVYKDTATKDYNSHEEMLLAKIYYKWGLVVNYNTTNTVPGNGSCVFIHIWGSDHEGTAGCTAMKEDDMLRLLHWIKNSSNPLLVQLPKEAYVKISSQYNLPSINF